VADRLEIPAEDLPLLLRELLRDRDIKDTRVIGPRFHAPWVHKTGTALAVLVSEDRLPAVKDPVVLPAKGPRGPVPVLDSDPVPEAQGDQMSLRHHPYRKARGRQRRPLRLKSLYICGKKKKWRKNSSR
jgi:hypothetical protein